MDDYGSKVMSHFCQQFELMVSGKCYQIEKLELKRKRYPQTDALYFVKPTKTNIKLI